MKMKKLITASITLTLALTSIGCTNADATHMDETIQEKTTHEETAQDKTAHESNTDIEVNDVYFFPHENDLHEGTWLQWPHDNTYKHTKEAYEHIWIEMTRALVKGENVHIIAYDEKEKKSIIEALEYANVDMTRVDFYVFPTDDVWSRDNGPIFVFDEDDNLLIQNWQFNGWGNKTPYTNDNAIPGKVGHALGMDVINIDMVMEGGALELDGKGTLFSTLSCVNNDNRTPEYSLEEIEDYLMKYYGVTNFVWLDGVAGEDITDNHIDGIIKVVDETLIITSEEYNLDPIELDDEDDAKKLLTAKNAFGQPYEFVFLPETKHNVVEVEGEKIKGAYLNFYVGNKVVLVPNYDDPNDAVANAIIQNAYPNREVVGIEVRDLYADGGMIHCVTQQQPAARK